MWDRVETAVGEVFREARAPDLRALSVESLEKLSLTARQAHEALSQQILDKGAEQQQAAANGDWSHFGACREEVRRLQEEWLDLRDQINHLEEVLRRKRLDQRVIDRLGGRGRAVALEATVVVLIFVVLGMLVWEETLGPGNHALRQTLALIDTCICVFFLGEFFWKMSLADSAGWYFKRHWVDFVSSLPFALLHAELLRLGRAARLMRVARAARIARMARFMRLLRALRGLAFVFRGFEKLGQSLNIRVLNRPLVATFIFLIVGGILMGMIEGDAFTEDYGTPMRGGIWWSFATVCTGGFADIHDPDSDWGRVLTVLLVILGAILTGAFTAALASVLLGDDTERIERKLATVLERLNDGAGNEGGGGA